MVKSKYINKLSLNVKKSNLFYLVIFKTKVNSYNDTNIFINNEKLEEKSIAKYLGVYFDDKLTWEHHINYTNKKLSRGIGILAKMRHYVSENTLTSVYNAFIQPHIDYGVLSWASSTKTHLKKIDISLKKAVRVMSFKKRNDHSLPLFKHLNILPLDLNIRLQTACFIWKYVNDLLPSSINKIFKKQNINTYIIDRRNQPKLPIPYCRTSMAQRCITYNGIKQWNFDVPTKIADSKSLSSFRSLLKSHLLVSKI